MKNKLVGILVSVMLVLTAVIVIVPDNLKVEATSGGGGDGGDDDNSLNNSYIWNRVVEFANVIYDAYEPGDIPKGRAFGSKGGNYTVNNILTYQMGNIMGLEDVHTETIQHINNTNKNYTSIIDVNDFQLTVNNTNYPLPNPIPTKESFVIPSGYPDKHWEDGGSLTHIYNFTDVEIRPHNMTSIWPWGGSFNDYSLNITSFTWLNTKTPLIGNITYIANDEEIPDFNGQCGRVFLFDDTAECQNKLTNLTTASGSILIDQGTEGVSQEIAAKCSCSVVRISDSDGDTIKGLIENYSMVLVDNVTGNITLTYNLNEGWWGDGNSDFVFIDRIPTHYESDELWKESSLLEKFALWLAKVLFGLEIDKADILTYFSFCSQKTKIWWWLNNVRPNKCRGIILFDSYEHHFMITPEVYWDKNQSGPKIGFTPAIPTFTLNYTVGSFLCNNYSCTTLTGYCDQEYFEETKDAPGIEAYNVIGNISIENSPDDAIAIVSNRYDGWWGQTPGDSGVGGAIVLGIAKYIREHNIKPKYNLTFLFTTGEEYGLRGAHHYNDSHQNDNIVFWLVLDQLAFDQSDTEQEIGCGNGSNYDIIWAIINQSQYEERTGYVLEKPTLGAISGTEQSVFNKSKNCSTFCIAKDKYWAWDRWHRAGSNYTEGDSLKYIDRNDVNVTAELAWNITKYFIVNPDTWFSNYEISSVDTDDADELVDSVNVNFSVKSVLPSDLLMVEAMLMDDENIVNSEYLNFTINSSGYDGTILVTLPSGCSVGEYNFTIRLYNSTGRINEILDLGGVNFNDSVTEPFVLYPYGYNLVVPNISNVSAIPGTVGFGYNVTISADVTSNVSNIDLVWVIIWEPDFTIRNFTMNKGEGDSYVLVFNDTWKNGQYKFRVWVMDVNGNMSFSDIYVFNVTAEATISVCTVKDTYTGGEIVNLTDPPNGGGSTQEIGYELLDDKQVLHIWNRLDSYYFNTSNGIQFTNHKDEYWSHNMLMLGYYDNDVWNLIYRTDSLSGFNKNIESDNLSFVNATLWKDLSFGGYDFRLAIRYYLGVDDNELTIIPYIKNIDDGDIPYVLGFGWEIKDIQVDMTPGGDYIEIDGDSYYLNEGSLDETYTNLDKSCYYISEDMGDICSKSLYLRWDDDLNYKVKVKSQTGQYNAPVTLYIRIGTLDAGQEKYTSLFWYDADQITYYFDGYDAGEAWNNNPSNMIDADEDTYASTTSSLDIELCNNNTCDGTYRGIISKVEYRLKAYYTGSPVDIKLRPVYGGTTDGNNYTFDAPANTGSWSNWFEDTSGIGQWSWDDIKNLDCDIQPSNSMGPFTLYCSRVELRVTYTSNYAPVVSDPVPSSGSMDVSITPLLNITIFDADNDLMNITWYSNHSGSWQIFGTNDNVTSGTYNQIFSNASVNGQWWYWYVNVSDGTTYTVSDVFSFYTGSESKICNVGSLNISGYLKISIEFYNTSLEEWYEDLLVISDTTPRVINADETLGLDTIFNPENVNTSMFRNGDGTYRVYAALRDPYGNVLNVGDSSQYPPETVYLEDWYEFTVTYD